MPPCPSSGERQPYEHYDLTGDGANQGHVPSDGVGFQVEESESEPGGDQQLQRALRQQLHPTRGRRVSAKKRAPLSAGTPTKRIAIGTRR